MGPGGGGSGWREPWDQTLLSALAGGPRDKRPVLITTSGDREWARLWGGCMKLWGWQFAKLTQVGHLVEETGIFISGLFLLPVTPKLLSSFPLDLPSHRIYSSSAFVPSFCIIFLVFSLCLSLGSPQSVPRDKDVSARASF